MWRNFLYFEHLLVLHIGTILLTVVTLCGGDKCVTKNQCKCVASAYEIDLSPLMGFIKDNQPLVFDQADPDGKYLYSWQPCQSFDEQGESGTSKCDNVASCQITNDKTQYIAIGVPSTAQFGGDALDQTLHLTYTSGDRTTNMSIVCGSEAYKVEVIGEDPTNTYRFVLHTKYACVSTGLSVGSVLLIVFFVGVLVYLVGGFIFLRFCRGARGVEQMPNYEFWSDFPLLIKDGVVFTLSGCKSSSTDATYEKI